MTTISSISELLSLSGSQFRVYDVGRKIDKISKDTFNKIELNQLPYPFPIQGHACFAIVFWQKESTQPYIWFIKLPLDERGLLNQAARNHYLAIIIEALGNNIAQTPSIKQEELLKSNPYHFTPAQYKLAALNSIINAELKREMSTHYPVFKQYLSDGLAWQNWHHIGVQGLNDFAAHIKESSNADSLAQAIPFLPEQVVNPLCIALENQNLPLILIQAILNTLKQSDLKEETKNNLIRSLGSSAKHPLVLDYVDSLLKHSNLVTTETIILLVGRLWEAFEDNQRLLSLFEVIANMDDLALFNEIFKDLVAIPSLRLQVLEAIRSEKRSGALSHAIGHLFQAVNKG